MKASTAVSDGSGTGVVVMMEVGVGIVTVVVLVDVCEGTDLGLQALRRSGTWRMSSPVLVKRK